MSEGTDPAPEVGTRDDIALRFQCLDFAKGDVFLAIDIYAWVTGENIIRSEAKELEEEQPLPFCNHSWESLTLGADMCGLCGTTKEK